MYVISKYSSFSIDFWRNFKNIFMTFWTSFGRFLIIFFNIFFLRFSLIYLQDWVVTGVHFVSYTGEQTSSSIISHFCESTVVHIVSGTFLIVSVHSWTVSGSEQTSDEVGSQISSLKSNFLKIISFIKYLVLRIISESAFHVGWKNQNKHLKLNSSFDALSKWHEPDKN